MSVGEKGDSMPVMFCPIHLSTFLDIKDKNCAWDKSVGPRPGRGVCEKHMATVVIGYGVRVWEMGDVNE